VRVARGTPPERQARMTRLALLVVTLTACAGSSTYYPPPQPGYASQTVQTTNLSADGSQTSTTTTTTTFQSSSYEEPAPPPPEPEPAVMQPPPPPPPTPGGQCDPRDTREMCIAVGVMVDISDILASVENESCRRASKELNRYADHNRREIRVFMNLEHDVAANRLAQFQQRHGALASVAVGRALELEARCDGDDRVHRALERVGFTGLRG
jgi:hypothetical protein